MIQIIITQKTILFRAVFLAFVTLFYLRGLSHTIVDPDIWHEMALIREAMRLGHIPLRDSFAYTPTIFPSVHHEWGAGVIAYFLSMNLGAPGILALKYILAGSVGLFVHLCLKRRSLNPEIFLLTIPIGLMLIQEGFSTVRAQMYSFVLSACFLWFLELDRNGYRKWIAFWIPLYLIWLNLHGGFLVAFGILGGYWIERILQRKACKHIILLGFLMLVLIVVNPYGLAYYQYLFRAILMPRLTTEWHPIWINLSFPLATVFYISLGVIIYSIKKIGIRNADGIAILLIFAFASIFTMRLIFFYAIIWTVYVPGYLHRTQIAIIISNIWERQSNLILILLIILTVAVSFRIISFQPWNLLVPSKHMEKFGNHAIYPVGPVEYLSKEGFEGNLMVYFEWGAYVMWRLHPKVRVSMDSRYEVAYQEWQVAENRDFYKTASEWENILYKYPTDLVLVDRESPLAERLHGQKQWKKIYTDNVFQLYARPGLILPVENKTGFFFEGKFP